MNARLRLIVTAACALCWILMAPVAVSGQGENGAGGLRLAIPGDEELPTGRVNPGRTLSVRDEFRILLVADGFTASEMSDFYAITDELAQGLLRRDPSRPLNEPFGSFDTVTEIRRLNVVHDPSAARGTAVRPRWLDLSGGQPHWSLDFNDDEQRRLIEDRARAMGVDQLVYVVNQRLLWQTTGAGVDIRGPAIPGSRPPSILLASDASQPEISTMRLIHELGHTVAGLADEYSEYDQSYPARWSEPIEPNATKDPSGGKWSWWIVNHPAVAMTWDRPIGVHEGGAYFARGVYRPAESCMMRDLSPYCAVCREAVAQGIRRAVGSDLLHLEYQVLGPWVQQYPQTLTLRAASGVIVQDMPVFSEASVPTSIRMRILASTLPKNWSVRWNFPSRDRNGRVDWVDRPEDVDRDVYFDVRAGDWIDLEMSGDNRYSPRFPFPTIRVQFRFNQLRSLARPPELPHSLSQTRATTTPGSVVDRPLPVGGSCRLQMDSQTGHPSPSLVSFYAGRGEVIGWPGLSTRVEIRLRDMTGRRIALRSNGRGGWTPERALPPTSYFWEARSVYANLASPWTSLTPAIRWTRDIGVERYHFEVLPFERAADPVPPHDPVDLIASPLAGRPGQRVEQSVSLAATSWDWNGDRIRFEFELVPANRSFQSGGSSPKRVEGMAASSDPTLFLTTPALAPNDAGMARTSGSVVVGPFFEPHRWRVRAVDATGRRSLWVVSPTLLQAQPAR